MTLRTTIRRLAAGLLCGLGLVATPAVATVHDDLSTPTGWWWLHDATPTQVQDKIDEGFRLVDLEVRQISPIRFSATFVANSGPYASGWWWLYGQTQQQVADFLSNNDARLIDLQIYRVNGQKRYAIVAIPNTGTQQTAWWYYSDVSFDVLMDKVDENGARLVDIDAYDVDGETLFSGIMVHNSGAFAKTWWVYSNVTPAFVSGKLDENNARLIDIEPRDGGRLTVIMNENQGQGWWWYYGLDLDGLIDRVNQKGARLIDVEVYDNGGQTAYMAAMIDNLDACTQDVRNYADANSTGGNFGFRLERVNGATVHALNSDFIFYPASTVKVLPHMHAMLQVESNPAVTLNTPLNVYQPGDACDNDHQGQIPQAVNEPLTTVLRLMMEQSDNERTNAVIDFFGLSPINATIAAVNDAGNTMWLNHKLGCGGPSNDPANQMTCREINRVYERIARNQVFANASTKNTFYDHMLEGVWFADVIQEERPAGMTDSVLANFQNGITLAHKPGSVSPGGLYRSLAGWFNLPTISCDPDPRREYVFSVFFNDVDSLGAGVDHWALAKELVRKEIRRALNDWNACFGCPPDLDGDGMVGLSDLLIILSQWGPCPGCDGDINDDGVVDFGDLIQVLSAWGSCT